MTRGASSGLIIAVVAILAIVAAFAFGLIDIDQTRETQLPRVAIEGGQSPTFDVDTAKVAVGTSEESVTMPKVELGTTEEMIKVPTIEVEKTGN